jgi:hypothetical protein
MFSPSVCDMIGQNFNPACLLASSMAQQLVFEEGDAGASGSQ